MDTLVGKTIGGYRILAELGRGGMAVVYQAVHAVSGRVVALKVLLPEYQRNPEVAARFNKEALAALRLSHDHIVKIYEAGGCRWYPVHRDGVDRRRNLTTPE